MKRKGWTKFGLLAERSEGYIQQMHDELVKWANLTGKTIMNSQTVYSKNGSWQFDEVFVKNLTKEILEKEIKIMIVLMLDILISMSNVIYEMGYQQGDLSMVLLYPSSIIFAQNMTAQQRINTKNLIYGSVVFMLEEYSGEEGERLRKAQKSCYPMVEAICQILEGPLILAFGIEEAINDGLDYDNTEDLMKSMRKARKKGCSGTIKFDLKSNFRDVISFYFKNELQDTQGNPIQVNKEIYCATCSIV